MHVAPCCVRSNLYSFGYDVITSSGTLCFFLVCSVTQMIPILSVCMYGIDCDLLFQNEPNAPRPGSATFLRAHSRTGFLPQSARPASTEPPEEKLTVPKAQSAREVSG